MKSFLSSSVLRWLCGSIFVVSLMASASQTFAEDWIVTTGSMGGSWYPLGAVIVDILNKEQKEINFSQKPGSSIANLQRVGTAKAQIGFGLGTFSTQAIKGLGKFKGKPLPKIRNLATLTINYFTLLATKGSGIQRIEDLRGKRYIPMPRGNSGERLAAAILKVHGLSYNDLAKVHFVGPNDGVALMKDGHADAISSVTVVPLAAYTDLANARDIRVIGLAPEKIKAIMEATPGLLPLTIREKAYRGQTKQINTVGSFVHLVTNADLPAEKIYKITKILAENTERLSQVHKAYHGLNLSVMAKKTPIPFHRGAEKYYKERGAL